MTVLMIVITDNGRLSVITLGCNAEQITAVPILTSSQIYFESRPLPLKLLYNSPVLHNCMDDSLKDPIFRFCSAFSIKTKSKIAHGGGGEERFPFCHENNFAIVINCADIKSPQKREHGGNWRGQHHFVQQIMHKATPLVLLSEEKQCSKYEKQVKSLGAQMNGIRRMTQVWVSSETII